MVISIYSYIAIANYKVYTVTLIYEITLVCSDENHIASGMEEPGEHFIVYTDHEQINIVY